MNQKLGRTFYLRPAEECVTAFLGKVLVHQTRFGRLAGMICDVEAYPAFADEVHHGNKRTPRTEVMWEAGGRAYVYLIYGKWHQFAAVVNERDIPDVVFIRGAIPLEGTSVMADQWDRAMEPEDLANSPGKLCKSFLISKEQYGTDLCGDQLFLEDWGIGVAQRQIHRGKRVGINAKHNGSDAQLRFYIKRGDVPVPSLGARP